MKQNIGLLGGTFDPVHRGHVSIAEAFLSSELIDALWVLLTPDPPHKARKVQTSYAYRSEMLEAAFDEYDSIKISTVENTLPRPTYTIQTLEYLIKNYPTSTFYLCIGEDSLLHFTEWYRYQDILELCELLVARRPGIEITSVEDQILDSAHYINHDPIDISSSEIRERLAHNKSVDKLLPNEVKKIIERHSLYKSTN